MVLGGGFDLGTAYGRIVLTVDDRAVETARQSLAASAQQLGGAISGIGSSLTQLTAPVLAFGLTGLKAASDFDTVINQIRVFGELGPQDLERVRQAALKWGADTKFSALDASAGMLDLLKSGQSVEQAMQTMTGVLNLAGAGNLSLAQSAGIVSSSLAQFRLSADQSGRVADSLARAANASRAEVGDLGLALNNVGPVAAQFGLSFEDTNAILAVFAQNGIMGGEAGTALRSMLLNLNRPTEDVQAAFDRLNVSMYDGQGNIRDFNTIITELDSALDKLPVEQQNELMQVLAGTYGITGLAALRASDGIGAMRDQMAAAPDAATVASEQMNTFAGKIESLRGSIETLQITALTPLMNQLLAPLVDRIIGVVNSLTAWIQANPELAGQIMQFLAVLVTVGPTLIVIGKAISAVGGLFSGLGTIIGLVLSPLGLLVGAAALLFVAFETNFLGIRDTVQPIFDQFVGGLQTLFGVLGNFGEIVGEQGLGAAIDYVLNAFAQMLGLVGTGDFFEPLRGVGEAIVSFIQDSVLPIVERFVGLLVGFWESIQPGLQAFVNWVIADALPLAVDFFNNILRPAVEGIVNLLMDIWTVVQPALSALFNWFMAEGLPFITDALRWFMENILQPAVSLLTGIWDSVGPVLQSVYDWFVTTGLPFINDALTWFKDNILQPAVDVLTGIWNSIGPALQSVYDWFVTVGLPFINAAIDHLRVTYLDPLINTLKTIWDTIKPGVEAVYNWFRDAFQWIGTTFVQPVIDFINKIPEAVQGAINELIRLTDSVINNPIMQSLNPALASAASIWNQSKASLMGSGIDLMSLGSKDMGGPGMADVPYLIGRGAQPELFVPNTNGTFIPNADKLMGGDTFNVQVFANSREEGRQAADGFEERIRELRESRGRG